MAAGKAARFLSGWADPGQGPPDAFEAYYHLPRCSRRQSPGFDESRRSVGPAERERDHRDQDRPQAGVVVEIERLVDAEARSPWRRTGRTPGVENGRQPYTDAQIDRGTGARHIVGPPAARPKGWPQGLLGWRRRAVGEDSSPSRRRIGAAPYGVSAMARGIGRGCIRASATIIARAMPLALMPGL